MTTRLPPRDLFNAATAELLSVAASYLPAKESADAADAADVARVLGKALIGAGVALINGFSHPASGSSAARMMADLYEEALARVDRDQWREAFRRDDDGRC
jgi:hypothetical protein